MLHLLLAVAAAAAFALGMLTAGGAALLLIPVVSWIVGAQAVAPVVTLATMGSGLSRVFLMWRHIRWDITRWYLPGALAGAFLGARLFAALVQHPRTEPTLQLVLALFLLSAVLQFRFGRSHHRFRATSRTMLPVGFVVATLSGLIGGTGPVLNPFYLSMEVPRESMIATKAFNALLVHLTKIGTYLSFGALDARLLGFGLVAAIGAVLGNVLGRGWLRRIGEKRFRGLVLLMMACSGLLMLAELAFG